MRLVRRWLPVGILFALCLATAFLAYVQSDDNRGPFIAVSGVLFGLAVARVDTVRERQRVRRRATIEAVHGLLSAADEYGLARRARDTYSNAFDNPESAEILAVAEHLDFLKAAVRDSSARFSAAQSGLDRALALATLDSTESVQRACRAFANSVASGKGVDESLGPLRTVVDTELGHQIAWRTSSEGQAVLV
ncbi:hypothetical protein [Cellulomonas sp. URHE0023]|uniref:hypothetical protein n=1 Tax=Cellulomonas sp. URHE0023 TaxID=1380354 RepID=UPI00048891C1|nr:hypothetical protein [Cellulomonas sp. URHE0023]